MCIESVIDHSAGAHKFELSLHTGGLFDLKIIDGKDQCH